MKLSGLAVAGTGFGLPTAALAAGRRANERDPDSVLARLLEGNERFVSGQLAHPGRRPEEFAPLAEGQAPLAIIVGCSDSRVAPEVARPVGPQRPGHLAGSVAGIRGGKRLRQTDSNPLTLRRVLAVEEFRKGAPAPGP